MNIARQNNNHAVLFPTILRLFCFANDWGIIACRKGRIAANSLAYLRIDLMHERSFTPKKSGMI